MSSTYDQWAKKQAQIDSEEDKSGVAEELKALLVRYVASNEMRWADYRLANPIQFAEKVISDDFVKNIMFDIDRIAGDKVLDEKTF